MRLFAKSQRTKMRGLLLGLCACSLFAGRASGAVVEFSPPSVNFGEFSFALLDELSTTVQIRNTSDNAVDLSLLNSSCACTTSPDFPMHLAPHESTAFTVQFTNSPPGPFSNLLNIVDDESGHSYRYTVTGSVSPAALFRQVPSPFELFASTLPDSPIGRIYVDIIDDILTNTVELYSTTDLFEFRHGSFTAPKVYRCDVFLKRTLPLGFAKETLAVCTQDGRILAKGEIAISVRASLRVEPEKLSFGFMQTGDDYTKEITVAAHSLCDIQASITGVSSDDASVAIEIVEATEKATVRVTIRPLKKGATLLGRLSITAKQNGQLFTTEISVQGGAL